MGQVSQVLRQTIPAEYLFHNVQVSAGTDQAGADFVPDSSLVPEPELKLVNGGSVKSVPQFPDLPCYVLLPAAELTGIRAQPVNNFQVQFKGSYFPVQNFFLAAGFLVITPGSGIEFFNIINQPEVPVNRALQPGLILDGKNFLPETNLIFEFVVREKLCGCRQIKGSPAANTDRQSMTVINIINLEPGAVILMNRNHSIRNPRAGRACRLMIVDLRLTIFHRGISFQLMEHELEVHARLLIKDWRDRVN